MNTIPTGNHEVIKSIELTLAPSDKITTAERTKVREAYRSILQIIERVVDQILTIDFQPVNEGSAYSILLLRMRDGTATSFVIFDEKAFRVLNAQTTIMSATVGAFQDLTSSRTPNSLSQSLNIPANQIKVVLVLPKDSNYQGVIIGDIRNYGSVIRNMGRDKDHEMILVAVQPGGATRILTDMFGITTISNIDQEGNIVDLSKVEEFITTGDISQP